MEITFKKLSYVEKNQSYEKKYLDGINLSIKEGSIVSIIGDNLSIIAKLMLAIKRPTSGELKLGNEIIKRTSHIDNIEEIKNNIGYVADVSSISFQYKTVKDEFKHLMNKVDGKNNTIKHYIDSLKLVGLSEDYLEYDPNHLSYTESKKVMLALNLCYNPEVLILENFEKGLNYKEIDYFKKLFLKLKIKFNKTIIILSNNVEFMFNLVDNIVVINKKVLLYGDNSLFYSDVLYNYVEMPLIVSFTKYAKEQGHDILEYTDTKELLKELYRNIKNN